MRRPLKKPKTTDPLRKNKKGPASYDLKSKPTFGDDSRDMAKWCQKESHLGTTGFGLFVLLPIVFFFFFNLRYPFLTHSHMFFFFVKGCQHLGLAGPVQ